MTSRLPIEPIIPALRKALKEHTRVVLQAPPGAGKTTRVPLALLDEPWLHSRRIVMLEPRRLATRAAAHRMATTLGEPVGKTIGYRMRMETVISADTRLEIVTEGVLTRMLQADAALESAGIVIFDEFHERSLHADLGLALALQSQSILRGDLRILVMSATLDGDRVAALLEDAPVVMSEGRSYAVEVHYVGRDPKERIETSTARAVVRALRDQPGSVLAFLPGAAEIRRTEEILAPALPHDVVLSPLYGTLPHDAQDRAIAATTGGLRKVVLATSIAETSLTIEGITSVVDSGLSRVPRFSVRSGMSRLETIRVSRSSAEQRRGRAGRIAPGVCYRLWHESETAGLVEFPAPEILDADMAPLALELAAWGVSNAAELRWLDPPPPAALASARELLRELGALDTYGAITLHGRRMNDLPLHPRLAHMVVRAEELRCSGLACDVAAILSDRDFFRSASTVTEVDLRLRLEVMRDVRGHLVPAGMSVNAGTLRHARAAAAQLRRRTRSGDEGDIDQAGVLLGFAYPDRIGLARPERTGSYLLRNGRGASIPKESSIHTAPAVVVADLDGRGEEPRVYLAAPIAPEEIERHFADQIETRVEISWDEESERVRAREVERLGALVLRERTLHHPPAEAIASALLDWIRSCGISSLPWTKSAAALRARIAFLHAQEQGWPDVSDEHLTETLHQWLGPLVVGARGRSDLSRVDLGQALRGMLTWEQRRALDTLAPSHWTVPSGSVIPIDYSDPQSPVLAVRLQEMFGAFETPRVAAGRIPLTVHLLSPAGRPVQVTRDLASFWQSGYFDVRKDLKGRYPKHYWPDDPRSAVPTRRVRPGGK